MGTKGKRIFALVLAGLMALTFIVPSLSVMTRAVDDDDSYYEDEFEEDSSDEKDDFSEEKNRISELNEQYSQLQKQQTEIQAKLSQAQSGKAKEVAVKNEIDNQINNTIAQIDTLNEKIALLESQIAEKEKEMKAKQKEIDDNFELFKKRMRAMYISGANSNPVGLVLGADSYSQFLIRADVVTRVAQHDQDMIDDLTRQKKELEEIKRGIEEDKSDVEADKKEMEQKKSDLDAQMQAANERIHSYAEMEQAFLANKEELQKQMQQMQAEIDAIYAEINKNSSASYIGGEMLWPAPSLHQVTSAYGSRFGGSDFHTGMDISGGGAYGSTIVAANTGTVAAVNYSPTGYGKYLIIDHGGGVSTLYAHCSAIVVGVGDTVSRGQKIAEVGSTGWSTGPHVHFEVRIDGVHKNPSGYVYG